MEQTNLILTMVFLLVSSNLRRTMVEWKETKNRSLLFHAAIRGAIMALVLVSSFS
jgi:hypothetical protein